MTQTLHGGALIRLVSDWTVEWAHWINVWKRMGHLDGDGVRLLFEEERIIKRVPALSIAPLSKQSTRGVVTAHLAGSPPQRRISSS